VPRQRDRAVAVDCAAALVTAALEERPDKALIDGLVQEAEAEGYLHDLTAALALGFASNVEGIGKLLGEDPKELWRRWCHHEAESRVSGRPFYRREEP
jgi:hypothetical protein